jgi:tetratricopeptide (TPR) repeat protein/predicted Ser/Thr protein kinase
VAPVQDLDATEMGDAHAATLATGVGPGPSAEATLELSRGSLLGRYLVLAPLGAGGMGVVYTAYDPELDRKVAIKLWHAQTGAATTADLARGRLQREAQALARLAHPNVVAVFDVGTLDGRLFVAMEYIDGWTLGDWLALERRSLAQILEVFLAAGRGLAAAHAQGLVHRDIKPDNLMIGRDGRVRVMDFGLARTAGTTELPAAPLADHRVTSALSLDLTRSGGLLGTPAYMAPEQFHGRPSDARGDQFSFCVSIYEALYGERPFAGDTLASLAHNVTTGQLRPPPRAAAVPPRIRRALLRGLEPAAEDRFPALDDLLAALAFDPRIRRRRWLLGGGVGLVLGAALGAAVLWDRPMCEGAETRWAAVWSDARAEAVTATFAATGRPHAVDTAARVAAQLEQYGDEWAQMHRDACLATHLRGEQSDTLLDLRMRCLGDRLREVDALATLLIAADGDAADRAVQAVADLTPLAACADVEALAAAVPPPTDPAARAAVEALRARLAELESMYRLGRYHAGRALAEDVLRDSKATGHGPLIGEALRTAGEFAAADGDIVASEGLLFAAIDAAAAARDLEGHARAWIVLTRLAAVTLRRPEDALRWSRAMAAAVQLLPASPALLARARTAHAEALHNSGDFRGAREALEAARALIIDAHGPDDPRLADLDGRLGSTLRELDRDDEARAAFTRALELATRTLGEQHPALAGHLMNLANVDMDAGDYPAARERTARALALREATLGEQHFLVGKTRYNLANIDRLQGDRAAARSGGEAVLANFERALGPAHADVAYPLNFLGALAQTDGRLDEAEALFTRALQISERTLGPDNPELGSPLVNLGDVALRRDRHVEAEAHYARCLTLWERTYGPQHADLAIPLLGLARAALARRDFGGALAPAERGLALVETRDDLSEQRASIRLALARALQGLGRELPRARELVAAARADAQPGPAGDELRAELDALQARL